MCQRLFNDSLQKEYRWASVVLEGMKQKKQLFWSCFCLQLCRDDWNTEVDAGCA